MAGKAFPSWLLRGPLPLRAGGVRNDLNIPIHPSRSLVIRFAQDQGYHPQIEALQRCQAAFPFHLPITAQAREASQPPQPPRLASLRE